MEYKHLLLVFNNTPLFQDPCFASRFFFLFSNTYVSFPLFKERKDGFIYFWLLFISLIIYLFLSIILAVLGLYTFLYLWQVGATL